MTEQRLRNAQDAFFAYVEEIDTPKHPEDYVIAFMMSAQDNGVSYSDLSNYLEAHRHRYLPDNNVKRRRKSK